MTRLTHRQEDAEEIINDTLWIVWQRAATFRDASQVSTWIMGIAYRRALNMIRRAATHERVMALESADGEAAVSDSGEATENRQLLDFALAQLPLEQRLVLEFTYYLDHSCEEVAEIMECPVNTVKTRMFNARRKLRAILAEHGADWGDAPMKLDLEGARCGEEAARLLPWYVTGRLSPADLERVSSHLQRCAICRADVAHERQVQASSIAIPGRICAAGGPRQDAVAHR